MFSPFSQSFSRFSTPKSVVPAVFSAGFEKVNEKVQELMIAWVATMVKEIAIRVPAASSFQIFWDGKGHLVGFLDFLEDSRFV